MQPTARRARKKEHTPPGSRHLRGLGLIEGPGEQPGLGYVHQPRTVGR